MHISTSAFGATAASPLLIALAFAPGARGFDTTVSQEVSVGGTIRVERRDPGLVGGGNGGTGTSVNYDDGNLNYGRGLAGFAVQGRTAIAGEAPATEFKLEAVYFHDFVNADGETNFRPLGKEARERAGRNAYLNNAYVGVKGNGSGLRVGNQVLHWSDSVFFAPSIAPVNPISVSRRYQPGNAARDLYVALPMVWTRVQGAQSWSLQAFYLLGFEPSEAEAAGTLLSGNDYYSPGARFLQLGQGSPLVPDAEGSVITPATPFGSKVSRGADRRPGASGQFGVRLETAERGPAKMVLAAFAMRVHAREPIVSVRTGTLGGLTRTTAPDYTSSGSYFVEYVPEVSVVGASARLAPAVYTRLNLEYSMRIRQPLQIDDDALITAGLAPAAATAACAPNPAGAFCAATVAALNRNPIVASGGGISAGNPGSFFSTELAGYRRFKVSQYAASLAQGLPSMLGARQGLLVVEFGGLRVHGFEDGLLDASVSIRPDASGARRIGLASRSAWGYRLMTRLDYPGALGLESVSPSFVWIHDVEGNAPITLGTLLERTRALIVAADLRIDRRLQARLAYRTYLDKGTNAERFSDRDFIAFSVTRQF
jgi:hypothetical protein